MSTHRAHIIRNLEQMEENYIDPRKARRDWKRHVEKHGNTPIVRKCRTCSGKEEREQIKCGHRKPKRPNRAERDDMSGNW